MTPSHRSSDSHDPSTSPDGASPCEGCALDGTRRDFLREAVAALSALALVPARALAEMRPVSASRTQGSSVTYPLPPDDSVLIDKEREVILVRWAGMVYAFRRSCPHQRAALKWREEDRRFQCPKHKSRYQPDGTFISGRATRGMDRYAVRRNGNQVVVDLDKLYRQDKDGGGWTAALVKL